MPRLSAWMIRLSLLNMWLGFSIASQLLMFKGRPDLVDAAVWRLMFAHVDLLLVGWMLQLSLGTAYWILPRLPRTVSDRGRFGAALLSVISLNLGVWTVTAGYYQTINTLIVGGFVLQCLAMVAFIFHALPRVRPAFALST